MAIEKIYAHLNCSDLDRSIQWFEQLFSRAPDARPMGGLAEWHYGNDTAMQLFEDKANAGHGTLTLIVSGLREEYARLASGELQPGQVEASDSISLLRLRDPDGNLVVLAQPGRA